MGKKLRPLGISAFEQVTHDAIEIRGEIQDEDSGNNAVCTCQ